MQSHLPLLLALPKVQLPRNSPPLQKSYVYKYVLNKPIEVLIPERFRGKHRGHRAGFMSSLQLRPMGAGLELHGMRKDAASSQSKSALARCKVRMGCW